MERIQVLYKENWRVYIPQKNKIAKKFEEVTRQMKINKSNEVFFSATSKNLTCIEEMLDSASNDLQILDEIKKKYGIDPKSNLNVMANMVKAQNGEDPLKSTALFRKMKSYFTDFFTYLLSKTLKDIMAAYGETKKTLNKLVLQSKKNSREYEQIKKKMMELDTKIKEFKEKLAFLDW